MSFLTMQPASKFRLAVVLLLGELLAGCATTPTPPPNPQMSQLEIRQLQSREYDGADSKAAMKALIAALQDDGYIVSSANEALGLVTAAMEVNMEDTGTKNASEFWMGPGSGTYQTTKRHEVSATASSHANSVRIRINIVAKALTNTGGMIWSQPVLDAATYQSIFSKIDKSVFLQKQKM